MEAGVCPTAVSDCNGTKDQNSLDQLEDNKDYTIAGTTSFDQSEDSNDVQTAKSTSIDQSEDSKHDEITEKASVVQSEASKEDEKANPGSSVGVGVKLESDGRTLKAATAGGMSMMIIWAKEIHHFS